MPARINLITEEIVASLDATGGHVAAAARRLGVCSKTLRRRLSADPALQPSRPVDPVWLKAVRGSVAILDGSSPAMPGDNPSARYANHMLDVGGWMDDRREREPRVLSDAEADELAAIIAASEDDWEFVDAAACLAEYRSSAWERRLNKWQTDALREITAAMLGSEE